LTAAMGFGWEGCGAQPLTVTASRARKPGCIEQMRAMSFHLYMRAKPTILTPAGREQKRTA
jgi:hypothetical protein